MLTHTHALAHMYTHSHTLIHTHNYNLTHLHSYTHIHSHTDTVTHTHSHWLTQEHTHTSRCLHGRHEQSHIQESLHQPSLIDWQMSAPRPGGSLVLTSQPTSSLDCQVPSFLSFLGPHKQREIEPKGRPCPPVHLGPSRWKADANLIDDLNVKVEIGILKVKAKKFHYCTQTYLPLKWMSAKTLH